MIFVAVEIRFGYENGFLESELLINPTFCKGLTFRVSKC